MIQIDDAIISRDVFTQHFVCNYDQCKGICCLEGDSGAPLEADEADKMRRYLPLVLPLVSEKARAVLLEQGVSYIDDEHEEVTSLVDGLDCVFAITDSEGRYRCVYEQLYRQGLIDFFKPISCHLYPIRLTRYPSFVAVNFDRWSICSGACKLGKRLQVPVYKFVKEPLIKVFGEEWYGHLSDAAELVKSSDL